jgi:hypothetical protein
VICLWCGNLVKPGEHYVKTTEVYSALYHEGCAREALDASADFRRTILPKLNRVLRTSK